MCTQLIKKLSIFLLYTQDLTIIYEHTYLEYDKGVK